LRQSRLTLIFALLVTASAFAQQRPEVYLDSLKNAPSPAAFDAIIEKMEILSRKDSMQLEDYHYKSIIKIAEEVPFSDKVLPDAYRWVGLRYANGRMDEAIVYFLESTTLYEKQKKRLAEALSCFEVGLIHHKAKNFEAAKEYYNKALLLGRDSLDHRAVINCYNGIGLIFREEGKYEQAMNEFRKALQVAIKNKDIAWIGIMEGNVGSIFFRMRDFDSSLYHYRKNLIAIKKVKEEENEIMCT
jgi:tetratricopeptide (TPR) repeat protein